jgi:putative aminopeptidase FrvX
MPTDQPFLLDLLSTPSPTGFEIRGQRKWINYVRGFADAVENDAYGSAWATLKGSNAKAPLIMLEAHADEIGYMVKHISKDGFLFVDRVGGSDVATARGRRVDILGDAKARSAASSATSPSTSGTAKTKRCLKSMNSGSILALPVRPKSKKLGIRVGHPLVYADGVEALGKNKLTGRAFDNRIGGYILSQVLAGLAKAKTRPAASVVAVNAVQEEIGGHGARMVAHRLMPDLAIV